MSRYQSVVLSPVSPVSGTVVFAQAASHTHHTSAGHETSDGATAVDIRQPVKFPEALRVQTLANMRDHFQVQGKVQALLSAGAFDRACDLAQSRLGMASLRMHGSHEVGDYMPQGLQDAGTAMHRTASQSARVATDASANEGLKAPLKASSAVAHFCVACRAGHRLQ
jgi:hypothetical protein